MTGTDAVVEDVLPHSPAARSLRPGDVIVAVDGAPIRIADQLRARFASHPPETSFDLTIERNAVREQVRVTTTPLRQAGERLVGIGAFLSTRALAVDLPFEIECRERDVGGPSAGLAYALAIADMLDPADYAQGRTVAATAPSTFRGDVASVGGVAAKAELAATASADIMFVPEEQIDEVTVEDLEAIGVGSLDNAVQALLR